ncbi:hypothetical protein J2W61_001096 [Agrobacterium tumefaciens]|uniref:DUF3008 family protein n=4 Tax=Agrobacterium tumefaciens complex TaxID=1183400 RepID=A0AAW8LR23_AGRTU|nr:hypothetical protein [Agrobacterium tumefaciens]
MRYPAFPPISKGNFAAGLTVAREQSPQGGIFPSEPPFQGRSDMPAKSKAQQKAAGAALAAKRGETKKSSLQGASKSMEKSMTEKELEDFASTKRKGLPEKKSD